MMAPIRVLVVEDSVTIRRRLVEVLSADPALEVIAEADNGKRAIELCQALRPDVITLDMILPVMTGLAATEYIMAYCPTPILIVSSSFNRGELFRTYEALAAGALDILEKPAGDGLDADWERRLVAAVKTVSRVRVITHPRMKLTGHAGRAAHASGACEWSGPADRVVAIGASTGGPKAVLELLRGLPAHFPLPILIVIHIGRGFATGLAEWLDHESALRVACAVDGEPLPEVGEGRVILATPDRHMTVRGGKLRLVDGAERNFCRPSIDVLCESIAEEMGEHAIACLLTGMGCDGAAGLLAIRRAGGMTIAQDEATSVIFGMPREAVALSAARLVLPLNQIAPTLLSLTETVTAQCRRRHG
jgi:two-component system chemotaxis response regulator CheB